MGEERLRQGALALGLALDEETVARFARYHALLQHWGRRVNLTTVRRREDVIVRHFLDSLVLVPHLESGNLVDVGSGAGFPGAVCALVRPDLEVTLVERVQKKAAFLLTLRRELGLSFHVVAQDISRVHRHFRHVVSRAAMPPPQWISVGASLVQPGGRLFAMVSEGQAPLLVPEGLVAELDQAYDVGAGPFRLLGWRKTHPL